MDIKSQDSHEALERSPAKIVRPETVHREREPKKTMFTQQQTATLETEYTKNRYPSKDRRQDLADEFCIAENKIKVWFQNRRMKEKREKQTAIAQNQNFLYRRHAAGLDDISRTCIPPIPPYPTIQSTSPPVSTPTMLPGCYRACCVPLCSPETTRYDTLSSSSDSPKQQLTSDGAYFPVNSNCCRPSPQVYNDRLQRVTQLQTPYSYGYLSPMRNVLPLSPLSFHMLSPSVSHTTSYSPLPLSF